MKAGGKNAAFMKRSTPLNCVVRPASAISPPLCARRNPLFLLLPCLPGVKYPAITATSLVPFRKEVVRGETRHSMLKTLVRSCLSNFDIHVGGDSQPRWQKFCRRKKENKNLRSLRCVRISTPPTGPHVGSILHQALRRGAQSGEYATSCDVAE